MSTPVIETKELSRYFQVGSETVKALDGVNIAIQRGTFFGITGPSGSGKSTLLYVLGGMDRQTSGECRVLERELSLLDDNQLTEFRGRNIGFVYQSFHLIPKMTALQNVELPMIFNGLSRGDRRSRARTLLEMVGLGDRCNHRPVELSGGQQQRLAIARAMANEPPLILADEPTGNLDSVNGKAILEIFLDLVRNQGKTIVMISHDQTAIRMTDQSFLMLDGRIHSRNQHELANLTEAGGVC